MSQKFVVVDSQSGVHRISANRLIIEGGDVELFAEGVGQVGFFVKPISVVAEQAPEAASAPSAAGPADGFGLTPGEVVSFDVPPRIEIGVLNITAGSTDPCTMLEEMRASLPKTDRGECLTAILNYVGELVYRRAGSTPDADIDVLHGLKNAVLRMQYVARSHQQSGGL